MAELEIKPTGGMRVRVLAVVTAAAFGTGLLCVLLAGGGSELFVRRATLTTYLPDATGLETFSVVRRNGIEVGKVNRIEISGILDPQRAIRVRLRIRSRYLRDIPIDSLTSMDEDTLVGYPFIDIDPGKSRVPVSDGGVLQSEPVKQAADRADLIAALERNLTQVDEALIVMSSGQSKLGHLMMGTAEYDQFVSRIRGFEGSIRALVAPGSSAARLLYTSNDYDRVRNLIQRADSSLAAIQSGQGAAGKLLASDEQYNKAVAQLTSLRAELAEANAGRGRYAGLLHDDAAYRRVLRMLTSTDALLASLNAGEGPAGRLLVNPQLYESLNGSLRSLEMLLRDFRADPQKYLRLKVF